MDRQDIKLGIRNPVLNTTVFTMLYRVRNSVWKHIHVMRDIRLRCNNFIL